MDLGQTITRARMMGLGSPSWGAHDAELCVDAGTFDGLLMLMRNEGQRVEPLPWATRTMRMTLADGTCLVLREYPCTEGAQ